MRNIAHRGASGHAPENTRAAFDLAIRMGADAIETDVQLTADGQLVLFHDNRVDRTSNGRGPLASYSLADLRSLDVGSWFGHGAGPQRVLTLGETIDDYLLRIPVVFEIKDPRATVPLLDALSRAGGQWEVTSFHWGALLDARRHSSSATSGFLTPVFDDDLITRCRNAGFEQICPHVSELTPALVRSAHAAGLTVRAHGVRTRSDVDALFRTDVDGATVNWTEWIAEWREVTRP